MGSRKRLSRRDVGRVFQAAIDSGLVRKDVPLDTIIKLGSEVDDTEAADYIIAYDCYAFWVNCDEPVITSQPANW